MFDQLKRANLARGIDKNAKHIFRNREGHLSDDTRDNRQLFIDIVLQSDNYLGQDMYGTQWYAKTLPTGEQVWVQVRQDEIRNAGVNLSSKSWNATTGLADSR